MEKQQREKMIPPTDEMSRRGFVTTSAAGASAWALGVPFIPEEAKGANERLHIGLVGAGVRGHALIAWTQKLEKKHNVRISAVCDLWKQRRQSACQKIQEHFGEKPASYRTLSELSENKDIDAVLLATPDFQHAPQAAQCVQAGKDVYVEKPFGCDFEQVKAAWQTIKQSDRIVQMGIQSRGRGLYYGARDLIQSGALGQITYGEIHDACFTQQWRIPGAEDSIHPQDTHWNEFLTYLDPERYPWNPRHYREFRLFWPFSSGSFCQRMSHRIDVINLMLDSVPRYAVSLGGVYLWKDGRTNPDTVQCLLEYPGGTLITYHLRMGNHANARGIYLYGTKGTLDLRKGIVLPTGAGGDVRCDDPKSSNPHFYIDHKEKVGEKIEISSPPNRDHLGQFFECVRSRQQPSADVESGYAHAIATILANMAYRSGCRMEYDPELQEIRPALRG